MHLGWTLARSWGLVAYLALWMTALFGVLTSSRGGGGWLHSPTVVALHRAWSAAVVVATAAHVLVVVADPASATTLPRALLPLGPGPVALGVIAAWGLAAVLLSTSQRKRLGPKVWRAVHAASFGIWLLALAHGVLAGTDSGAPWATALYAGTAAALLAATVQRALLATAGRRSGR
jgi:sulfoxide reductase heme-binding subunit YedZ